MSDDTEFENACEAIAKERATYKLARNPTGVKVSDALSMIFFFAAFGALVLVPFTNISLLQATCLFVIHYTIAPSEVDLGESVIKGATVDLANIRASLDVLRKRKDI